MKKELQTVNGEYLMSQPLEELNFIVAGLIPQGLHILAGSVKVGKSWLVLWMCLQIAKGETVWNYETKQGTTLYLCLEDSLGRIQNRLFDITDDAPNNIHFATLAESIDNGLTEQIENFLILHTDTNLIVIDTLQKVRGVQKDSNQYANDYREIGSLKSLADKHSIAIILVHHMRKMEDDDPMNMISGTTGITGVVDSSFALVVDKQNPKKAVLHCKGRDIDYRKLEIEFEMI